MNSNKSIKVLLAIPVAVFIVGLCCFILAGLLEVPTRRGDLYTALMMIALFCMFLGPLPCLCLSGIGIALVLKAKRASAPQPTWLLALGIAEVLTSLLLIGVVVAAIFIMGPSV